MSEYDSEPKYDETIPEWDDMPEPEPLLTKSWEDFYPNAQKITRARWNRDPTKTELKEIFHECHDINCESGTYWSTVEYSVESYYDDLCSVCGLDPCECEDE